MAVTDDPNWLAWQQIQMHGLDGATAQENLFARLKAAQAMYEIEVAHGS